MIFTIHAWQIAGYVKLKRRFARKLDKMILSKFSSINKFSKICGINRKSIEGICQRNLKGHHGFTKTYRLFKITDFLKISRKHLEKQIEFYMDSKTGAYNRIYHNPFPFKITPLVIRLVAHLIGDGSVGNGNFRYSQQNVDYIQKLSEILTNPVKNLKKSKILNKDGTFKEFQFNIPSFVIKSVSSSLNINVVNIKNHIFLEKCLNLQKDYKIQVLCAIFVDEGSVEGKTIRMSDKKVVQKICDLIDSLGYKRGEMTSFSNILYYNDIPYIAKTYNVQFWAIGLKKFLVDIKNSIKKYGPFAGLWNKQSNLKNKVKSHDFEYIENIDKFRVLKENIKKELRRKKILKLRDVIKNSKRKRESVEYLFKSLVEEGAAINIGRGIYLYDKK